MNNQLGYQQFIYGKTINGAEYRVVAYTRDCVGNEVDMLRLQARYGFSGPQPPKDMLAAGLFEDNNGYLILVQAQQSFNDSQAFYDAHGRVFTLYRYIYVPLDMLGQTRRQLAVLLIKLASLPIPTFSTITELPALLPTVLELKPISLEQQAVRIEPALRLIDMRQRSVVVSALAAIINGQRIIFTPSGGTDVESDILLDSVIALLPTPYRTKVAIAVGTLDERYCKWAKLLLKYNGVPTPAEGLIIFDHARNRFIAQSQDSDQCYDGRYVRLIQHLINVPDMLLRLLEKLDSMTEHTDQLADRNSSKLPLDLLMLLDDDHRAAAWQSIIDTVDLNDLTLLLPAISALKAQPAVWDVLTQRIDGDLTAVVPLLLALWQQSDQATRMNWLGSTLLTNPAQAELLLTNGLIDLIDLGTTESVAHNALFGVCRATVAHQAQTNVIGATRLARLVIAKGVCRSADEQFLLLDQASNDQQDSGDAIKSLLFADLVPLIWDVSPQSFIGSKTRQVLACHWPAADEIIRELLSRRIQAIMYLPALADALVLTDALRSTLYASVLDSWNPPIDEARTLLLDLLQRSRMKSNSVTWSWRQALNATASWYQDHMPNIVTSLAQIEQQSSWQHWQMLADTLCPDPVARVRFLDTMLGGQPQDTMLRRWLELTIERADVQELFEGSNTCRLAQNRPLPAVQQILPVIVGQHDLTSRNLLALLEQAQKVLDLSWDMFFALLERIPDHATPAGRPSFQQRSQLLDAYLRHNRLINQQKSAIWQSIRTDVPQLAEVFVALQGNALNRSALDRFILTNPEHSSTLARWIRLAGRADLLNGNLLEQLSATWWQQGEIDADFLHVLTSAATTGHFLPKDWLLVCRLCWILADEHVYLKGDFPILSPDQQSQFVQYAFEAVRRAAQRLQVQRVLDDAQRLGLNRSIRTAIVQEATPSACSVQLVCDYLYVEGELVNPETQRQLIELLLQLTPHNQRERTMLEDCMSDLVLHLLQKNADQTIMTLAHWKERASDKQLYIFAFTRALRVILEQQSRHLLSLSKQMGLHGLDEEREQLHLGLYDLWQGKRS